MHFLVSQWLNRIKVILEEESKEYTLPSLFVGKGGDALFWAGQYLSSGKKEDKWRLDKNLEFIIEQTTCTDLAYSLSSGITGVFWLFRFLGRYGLITPDYLKSIDELDEYVDIAFWKYIEDGNYDYLHGYLGLAKYYKEKGDQASLDKLRVVFETLKASAIKSEHGVFWLDIVEDKKEDDINFGLAHGVPSIILFLVDYYVQSKDIEVRLLLIDAVSDLRSHRVDDKLFSFGNTSSTKNMSRVAWCYGDLGCGLSIYKAGLVLNNQQFMADGIDILLKAAGRNMDNAVIDTPFICHGYSGTAYIFYKLYLLTERLEFYDAFVYWLNVMFDEFDRVEKAGTIHDYFSKNRHFLTGTAGVGLVLDTIFNNREYTWDELLMV